MTCICAQGHDIPAAANTATVQYHAYEFIVHVKS